MVKMLLKRVDSLTPKVKMASARHKQNRNRNLQLKECDKIKTTGIMKEIPVRVRTRPKAKRSG
jgi:hypothetical protein